MNKNERPVKPHIIDRREQQTQQQQPTRPRLPNGQFIPRKRK